MLQAISSVPRKASEQTAVQNSEIRTMKLLFMGSIPTYDRDDVRDVIEQESPFVRACKDMGYVAASRGHTVMVADNHVSSADLYVAQGVAKFAVENPEKNLQIEINRPERSQLTHADLPKNVGVRRFFHSAMEDSKHGTGLLPNLAALDACDMMITIGGKLTVRLMGNIAADRDKGFLAIPAFGGSSAELYERLKYTYRTALKDRPQDLAVIHSVWLPDSAEKIIDLAEALSNQDTVTQRHSYFISYTWDESALADHVEVLLQRNERSVNRDESIFQAGVDLEDVVKSLIQQSDTFVALWSERFRKSTWCPNELAYAMDRQAKGLKPERVVLLTMDDTEVPIRSTGKLRLRGDDREKRELSVKRLIEEE